MTIKITLLGNVNIDLIMGPSDFWPKQGTEVILPHCEWRVGGASGNTALALQALGADFNMIANIGNDDFGLWLRQPFISQSKAWTISGCATGLSVGLTHPDGERTFFTSLGHLNSFSLDDVASQLPEKAEFGEVVLLSGAFVTPKLSEHYNELMVLLRKRGFSIALDTGWPSGGWTHAIRDSVLEWCSSCDHLLLNELETRSLLGMMAEPAEDVARLMLEFIAPDGTVVLKCGAAGAIICKRGEVLTLPAPTTKVIDTIGAGDVFNAGYLFGLTQNSNTHRTLELAIATASRAISTSPRSYFAPVALNSNIMK